jgi:hypothetical protein
MLFRHVAKSIGHECLSYEKRTKADENLRKPTRASWPLLALPLRCWKRLDQPFGC